MVGQSGASCRRRSMMEFGWEPWPGTSRCSLIRLGNTHQSASHLRRRKSALLAAEGDRLAALYRLALTLGLRRGELLGLRWQDVDRDGGRLRVTRSLQRVNGAIVIK